MTYDALAMHAIRDELEATLVSGRIDAAYLIDARRLGLDLFAHGARRSLVLSLDPNDSRVYLSTKRVGRGTDQVTPFLLLVRKYVRGSIVVAVEQPRLERVLIFRLSSRPDQGLPREVQLIAEAMGRRSNLVLVDEDGAIMDVLDRVPPNVNPRRPLLPHLRYEMPPAETKTDPTDPDLSDQLVGAAEGAAGPAANLIVRMVAGMSPLAAREALYRAAGSGELAAHEVTNWSQVAAGLAELAAPIADRRWNPTIAWAGDQPLAFAPYELRQLPDARVESYASMSEVVELAATRTVTVRRFERLKEPLLEALRGRADQARRKRGSLERSLGAAEEADWLRWAGEAILANAAQIPPDTPSFDWEGRRIDLYPSLSAVENAQSYFRRYTDARDAKRVVPPLLDETARELEYLDEMALHVEMADSERELVALRRELEAAGVVRPPRGAKQQSGSKRGQSEPSGAHRRLTVGGAELLMGTSAVGNETVTFRLANPDDLWFHVRGAPGAHVILRTQGREPPERWILAAAQLAAAHSARRDEGRVDVDYAPRKLVRKIPGAAPGRVTYRNEATIAVAPATPDDLAAERSA